MEGGLTECLLLGYYYYLQPSKLLPFIGKRPISKVGYFLLLFLTEDSRSVFVIFRFWLVAWCPTQPQLTPPISGSNHVLSADNYRLVDLVVSCPPLSLRDWAAEKSWPCLDFCWETSSPISRLTPPSAGSSSTNSWATRECARCRHVAATVGVLYVWTYSCNGA